VEGSPIDAKPDPWETVYGLEQRRDEPDFRNRWCRFVRSVVPLLPRLPAEAGRWWEVADAYGGGRLGLDSLMAAQHHAWRYLSNLSVATPDAEYCAVRAAMQPLWDYNTGGGWFDGAWCFLHDCGAAGVTESQWWPLLLAAFPELDGGRGVESGTAPDPARDLGTERP
jgi:hypothetical protein